MYALKIAIYCTVNCQEPSRLSKLYCTKRLATADGLAAVLQEDKGGENNTVEEEI